MTKALRITSIIVAAAAVLLVALPPVFTSGTDEQTQKFLDSPGVLETIKKTKTVANINEEAPLVTQAKAFAKYLNPPKPAPSPRRRSSTPRQAAPVRPRAQVSSQFDLLGTSYYALRPNMSMALINEPGAGLRWVKQSSKIGSLIVEEVRDGKVVIRDGARTYEIEPKRTAKRSLIKGESSSIIESVPARPSITPEIPTRLQRSSPRIDARRRRRANPRPTRQPQPTQELTPEQIEQMDQQLKKLKDIEDPVEWMEKADEMMKSIMNNSEVTDEEAAKLDQLGQELNDANDDANSN
jgi:hypothetical protein